MANPVDWLRLRSEFWSAAVDPAGAQLSVLRDATGRDLLWNGDPAYWTGRAPILFPIVGTLNEGEYRWRGKRHALSRHGFARGRDFEVLRQDDEVVHLRLTSDEESLKVYPFHFELDLVYCIDGPLFMIEAIVRNMGDEPLPASLGFHPALRWPLPYGAPRDDHFLEFEVDEPAPIRRLDAKGLLTDTRYPTPVAGKRLALDDELFGPDVVIFDHLQSRSLTYGAATGPRIRVRFPDVTHLGLWTKPGAGFLCIEPWKGVSDPAGFAGEFSEKPGVFLVEPGEEQSLPMTFELVTAV